MTATLQFRAQGRVIPETMAVPEHIVKSCLMTPSGVTKRLTGADAKRVLLVYLEYVKSGLTDDWKDADLFQAYKLFVAEQQDAFMRHLADSTLEALML